MQNFNFPKNKIPYLKKFQIIIREKIQIKKTLNLELNNYYNIIYGVMKRIHNNFLLGITNQYDYNTNMGVLDEILNEFKKIKRPLTFKDIRVENQNIIYINLEKIRFNLIDLASKSGVKDIFEGIKLILGIVDKKFMESLTSEEKKFFKEFTKR